MKSPVSWEQLERLEGESGASLLQGPKSLTKEFTVVTKKFSS